MAHTGSTGSPEQNSRTGRLASDQQERSRLTMAADGGESPNRLVFVILRGGMDGLYTVPAVGDPDFAQSRGILADYPRPPLPLSDEFALHPDLVAMHAMYGRGELAVIHAAGLPGYYGHSHFDAQNMLETGSDQPFTVSSGWLGRALGDLPAVGLATRTPLALRGAENVGTWAPSTLPQPSADLLERLEQLYAQDPDLSVALARARAARFDAEEQDGAGPGRAPQTRQQHLATLARRAAELLADPDGARVAVLEQDGWDSHGKENDPEGPIARQLPALDTALAELRDGLQADNTWSRTVVVVATEFGREVAVNGTGGTDHGGGGAAFVLGGAVKGGQVVCDWPGLAMRNRHENRDLRITTDIRSVLKAALGDHLQIPATRIDEEIFPGSRAVRPMDLFT